MKTPGVTCSCTDEARAWNRGDCVAAVTPRFALCVVFQGLQRLCVTALDRNQPVEENYMGSRVFLQAQCCSCRDCMFARLHGFFWRYSFGRFLGSCSGWLSGRSTATHIFQSNLMQAGNGLKMFCLALSFVLHYLVVDDDPTVVNRLPPRFVYHGLLQ